jgi:hypothetical protein
MKTIPALTCVFVSLAGAALANWPTWRGPLANGVAPQTAPPVEWSESNNVKW